ncbi:multicopper oxidase domain-containing protein [Nostoc sp.]
MNGKFVGGQFVYHCHLLYHEDHGMMQNILVLPPVSTGLSYKIQD